jgi:hypothetical protein
MLRSAYFIRLSGLTDHVSYMTSTIHCVALHDMDAYHL